VKEKARRRVEELLPKPEGGAPIQCLDAGCGNYHFTMPGYHVHRCDIRVPDNPACLSNFKLADLNQRWPYNDGSFHVVRAVEVIEHLENPWHFFREARRVLKPGGVTVLSTPNPQSPASRELFHETGYFHWFAPHNRYEFQERNHITPVFLWQIEWICDKLGLVIEAVRYDEEDPSKPDYQDIMVLRIRKPRDKRDFSEVLDDGRWVGEDKVWFAPKNFTYIEGIKAKLLLLKEGGLLLDVGCGSGLFAWKLKQHYTYVGVDKSERMLELAKLRNPEVTFFRMDARRLEFPDGEFDVVICVRTLKHFSFDDARRVFSECVRVLKPGGIFAFSMNLADRRTDFAEGMDYYDIAMPPDEVRGWEGEHGLEEVSVIWERVEPVFFNRKK